MKQPNWNSKVDIKLAINPNGLSRYQIYKCRGCGEPTVFSFRLCACCLDKVAK
jgi:hypothetical protein